MPPVDVSSQNLRERSLQVSAPRVPAGGVHGEKNASAHLMCLLTAPAILNIEPPPQMPSILPTVRPLLMPFFLMWTQSALNTWPRVVLPEMPVTFARAEDTVTGLKMPLPAFFSLAAFFLPAAIDALLLCWPLRRLPPTKRTFFAFFFFRFFFFFFFFFGFLAFFAFFALGFLAFFAFAFLAAVSCVRASDFLIAFFTTTTVSSTTGSSSNTMTSVNGCVCP